MKLKDYSFVNELTFEDWKNGEVPIPPPTWDRKKKTYKSNDNLHKIGLWPFYWAMVFELSMMKQSELDKIEEEQERVFKLAVEFTVKCFVLHFKEGLKYMSPEEQSVYQRNEKARIKDKLDNDRDNIAKMLRGVIPREEICNNMCEIIQMTLQLFEDTQKNGGTLLGGNGYLFESSLGSLYKTYIHYQYLNELEEIVNEPPTKEEKFKSILNTSEGIKAGKMALMHYLKWYREDVRTWDDAFAIANKFHKTYRGKPIYKNKRSFEVSKQQFENANEDWQLLLNKILKDFK